jgi:4-amino-4-deoxy-L-arabinose transferase-like glycosyltransferase
MRLSLLLAVVAILLIGTFLRVYQLNRTPPGLFYDEAFNAIQSRNVERGTDRPIFFADNNGEEPLQMYVGAALFALIGESAWASRLSCALLGLLLIPALYFAARVFFRGQTLTALVAAFVGATLYWAVSFSRVGEETSALPAVLTLSAGALLATYSTRSLRWALVAGLLLGATLYTYLASRLWPVAVALWVGYLLLVHRQELPARFKTGIVVAAVALLTFAPLGLYFLANPLAFLSRAEQVVRLEQLVPNLVSTLGMFFLVGDPSPRYNLPGRPALDPFLALLFLVGLVVAARRARQPAYALLLIWFVVMTVPSVLTESAPNFRRAIGALPAVALLCGIGANWIWQSSRTLRPQGVPLGDIATAGRPSGRRWNLNFGFWNLGASLLLLLGLSFSAWSSANAYFNDWAHNTGLFYAFDDGLLQVAQTLAARPGNEQLCLSPDYHDHPTVQWALDTRAYSTFDGRRVAVLPDSALPATCAIITREDQTFSLARFYPGAQRLATIYDLDHKPYAQIFHIPAGAIPNLHPQHPLAARVGDSIRVLGYGLARTGDTLKLKVYWRATGPLQKDYTVFVHLLGPQNPEPGSPVWAQDDTQPGLGTYPTSRWRAGQTIIDRYTLQLPANAPAGRYQIEAGMYLLATGERLPVWVNGQRTPQDRLLLGDITK